MRALGRLIAIEQNARSFSRTMEDQQGILTEVPTTVHEVKRDLQPEVRSGGDVQPSAPSRIDDHFGNPRSTEQPSLKNVSHIAPQELATGCATL